MKYDKIEGKNLEIQFRTALPPKDSKWALDLTKRNMQQVYDDSGYAWCDADKKEELVEHGGAARFLVVRKDSFTQPVAFAHFRFTLQGEAVGVEGGAPACYVMDIQLEPEVQRQGLGRHLMRTLEMIARKQGMMHLMMPVVVKDEIAKSFALAGLKDFALDDLSNVVSYDGQDAASLLYEDATFTIFSKTLSPAAASTSQGAATTPAKKGALPSDGDLSAASTPAKDEAASAFGVAGAASPVSPLAFDPTFGAPATASATDAVADSLLAELVTAGVIPASMGSDAKPLIQGLMLQYKEVHGRDANGDDIAKWLGKIADHANEDAADLQDAEEDDESDESQEGSSDEDESEDETK